jgi:hypothetical protein
MLKTSRATQVTEFPSKLTGEWTNDIYCHTLTSSGTSFNDFGTLGGKSPSRGKPVPPQ